MNESSHIPPLGVLTVIAGLLSLPCHAAGVVSIEKSDQGNYHVRIAGRPFTTLHTQGFAKPILYPVIGPHGVRMTRDFPMKEGAPNEKKDHPHHQSIWFTHGSVNGVDFWQAGKKGAMIAVTGVREVKEAGSKAWIDFDTKWLDGKGNAVCTGRQKVTFHNSRAKGPVEILAMDIEVTVLASEGDVVFGDTKEGSMGIRSHPGLRIDRGARAVNSEGVTGKAMWGKRAKWVDYSATIDGHVVGFAILDHPANPRHPTWWHARDYGLVAANPFGVHDFERKPKGAGDLKIARGESVTFRYRFLFHGGDAREAGIAQEFEDYAAGT